MKVSETDRLPGGERLEAIYEEGVRIFSELTQLCVEHRVALANRDLDRLNRLNERAETLSVRFGLLDSARRELEDRVAGGVQRIPDTETEIRSGPESAGPDGSPIADARRRLAEAAATAAVAASINADVLARTSGATAAIRRVLDGAVSAGYLRSGEPEPLPRSSYLEERA